MKVGDYVRTDDGLIGKVVSEPYEYKDSIGCDIDFGNNDVFNEYEMCQRIIKSSPNIIDLIEVGDYVNGDEVHRIRTNANGEKILCYIVPTDYGEDEYTNEDIETIVTREQFKAMEYRINE